MNLILLGPQGSGKGTQAKLLVKKYDLNYVGTGSILREIAHENAEIRELMDKGELVPDDKLFEIMTEYLSKKGIGFNNLLFDGFPRSRVQLHAMRDWLEEHGATLGRAILLQISDKEAVRRLSARRIHKKTGEIYNLVTNPPGPEVDKSELELRSDDAEKAIRERLGYYHEITEPLVKDLREDGLIHEINGEQSIKKIHEDIVKAVDNYMSS